MGGGGGGKGGGGAGAQPKDTQAATDMANIAKQLFAESTPMRQLLTSQGMEALRTGGVSASIPMVQQAIESSKMAASNAMKQTGDQLSQSGLAGTPYGEAILAQTGLQGEQAANQAGNAVGQWYMSMVPNFLSGQQATGANMFSGAAQSDAAKYGAWQSASANNYATNAGKGASQLNFLSKLLVG